MVRTKEPAPGFKRIELDVEEQVYLRLRDELGLKVAMGNFYGLQDELMRSVIAAIEDGKGYLKLELKKGRAG